METLQALAKAVLEGEEEQALVLVKKLLADGTPAMTIINDGLIAGMSQVGELFKIGEMFIPEVLLSAQVVTSSVVLVRPYLPDDVKASAGKVIIGTVKGDLHDIGKNLVALLLANNGFDVIDLGHDISPEEFAAAIVNYTPQIVGLSALLTTTMPMMRQTIDHLAEQGLRSGVSVIVGGAPVSAEYAQEIGADGYAEDAAEAVELCRRLLS